MKQLIINTEFFLQCYGHCAGCFLTESERNSNNTYLEQITEGLKIIAHQYQSTHIEHLIIGFGRGNILNLDKDNLNRLLLLMSWCETTFQYDKLTFEVSTSLIGKLDKQIENALFLLNGNNHIYFNIVVNSEITSFSFWKNLNIFYESTANFRQKEWGWKEDWGDIIVLNVNPNKLPNLDFIQEFTTSYCSPVNISIFPFEKNDLSSHKDLTEVINWSSKLWLKLKTKDLNIKNYLENLNQIDTGESFNDIYNYQLQTEKSYYFIDKNGIITNGSLSIMGEVDKIRLLEKYNLNIDILSAYKTMQKNKVCSTCEYQKECLLSGAYLNMMANIENTNLKNSNVCLSGYQKLFALAKE